MGRVVVHDDVDVELGRNPRVDLSEKVEKLGGPVPFVAFADDEAGGDIERCEERCGAMPDIGVGPALGHPGHHWQNGLLAVERLDLMGWMAPYRQLVPSCGRRKSSGQEHPPCR